MGRRGMAGCSRHKSWPTDKPHNRAQVRQNRREIVRTILLGGAALSLYRRYIAALFAAKGTYSIPAPPLYEYMSNETY